MQTFDSLVEWIASKTDDLGVPGAAVGVVIGNQRFTRGIGIANPDTGEAFTSSTAFSIASLTKIFTATALASLAHSGALRFDDAVRQHLPDFKVADSETAEAATLGHLVSHAGGWADVLEPVPDQDSLAWYAGQLADAPQVASIGTQFSYSNSGFMLAGAVIEGVTGGSYEDSIVESVLHPLGMTRTGFANASEDATNRAIGSQVVDGNLKVIPQAKPPRAVNPAAGLISTLDDMLNFVQAFASITPDLLEPDVKASMRQPLNSGGSVGPVVVDHIGTGWMLLDIDGETVLMSQGGDAGLISAMVAVPAQQFGMVILANGDPAMMLVNDAVLRGLDDYVNLSLPEPEAYVLSDDEAANAEGQFGLPEWLTFSVTATEETLLITVSAGVEEVPDLSGSYTMTSATTASMPHLGGRLWIDLVLDATGEITWLRFAGRLFPRV